MGAAPGCRGGNRVTLLSRGFPRGHSFAGVPAVFATLRPNGRFSVVVKVPRRVAHKRYTVTARCGGGNLGVQAYFTVVG